MPTWYKCPDWAHVGVKVKRLSERHVDRPEARPRGSSERSLEDDLALLSRLQCHFLNRISDLLERDKTSELLIVLQVSISRSQNRKHGPGDFRADPVPGNYGDGLRHRVSVVLGDLTKSTQDLAHWLRVYLGL